MNKALQIYENELARNFLGRLLTPACIETMRAWLFAKQNFMRQTETNPVWTVPVDISINMNNHTFNVVITDESNLLFLHEENIKGY